MTKDSKRLKYDLFSIRCTTEQKEELRALLEQAEQRLNKGRDGLKTYKIRKNDIVIQVLRRFVGKVKANDF